MWDELYAREREMQAAAASTRPAAPEPPPNFWAGVSKVPKAVPGAFAEMGRAIGLAGSIVPIAADTFAGADNLAGESLADRYFRTLDDWTKPAIDYWSLPAEGVGAGTRILHGAIKGLTPLVLGPAGVMGTSATNAAMDVMDKGADAQTAAAIAMTTAGTAGLGLLLPPALGASRAWSAAIGAVLNPAIGAADRMATKAILEHQDYGRIAAQYKPFDPEALATEALMGAAFGAVLHKAPERKLSPDEQAALLTKIHADTRDADTLAKPGDIAGLNAGREAQALAMAQIDAGQPVNVAHLLLPDAPTVDAARAQAHERLTGDMRAELLAEAGNRAEPGEVPRAKQERAELAREIDRLSGDQAFRDEAKALQKQGLSRKEAESAARKSIADQIADLQARAERLDNLLETNRRAAAAEQDLSVLNRGGIPERFVGRVEAAAQGIQRGMQETPIAQAMRSMFAKREAPGHDRPAEAGAARQEPAAEARPARPDTTPEQAMAGELAKAAPDRTIRMMDADGRVSDVKASDVMAAMEREFAGDISDAKAFEAAATCFLMTGTP